jgi:hypothetical protein
MMATRTPKNRVVTWMAPNSGSKIHICRRCERKLMGTPDWPRDGSGQEYCQVSQGLHLGRCQAPCHSDAARVAFGRLP